MRGINCASVASAVLAAALFLSKSSAAPPVVYENAGDLNRLCTSKKLEFNALCDGYILGVFEAAANSPIYGYDVCVHKTTTSTAAMKITKEWLAAHRESDLEPSSLVIAKVLANAYPCISSK